MALAWGSSMPLMAVDDSMQLTHNWIPPVPSTNITGRFTSISNLPTKADRLLSVSADFAQTVEYHTMSMVNDMMQMHPVTDDLLVAQGTTLLLQPGGHHIMFTSLIKIFMVGEQHQVILEFAHAGNIQTTFVVKLSDNMVPTKYRQNKALTSA